MGARSSRRYAVRQSPENPQYPLTDTFLASLLGPGPTKAGVAVDEKRAMGIPAYYRAIAILSGLIGYMPLKAYMPDQGGRTRADITDQVALLREPYPDMTPYEWKELLGVHLKGWGNAYVLKVRNVAASRVMRLLIVPPWTVTPRRDESTADNPSGKVFKCRVGSEVIEYTPFEMMHIPGLGYDGVKGMTPIQHFRESLAVGVAAEEYAARLFGSGNLMGGILTTEQKLEEEDAERLKARWRQKMSGLARAHEIAVLDSAATWQQVSINPEDAQLLQSRSFSIRDVSRITGVPPHLLMDTEAVSNWGTGVEEHATQMLNFAVQPDLSRIEQRFTMHGRPLSTGAEGSGTGWLPAQGWCEFNVDALLRADLSSRYTAYGVGIQHGFLVPNEPRAKENLPPLPGGDEPLIPANMTQADDGSRIAKRAVAAKHLIEAGFAPADVTRALGLPEMEFVRQPKEKIGREKEQEEE